MRCKRTPRKLGWLCLGLVFWDPQAIIAAEPAAPGAIEFFEKQIRPILHEHCVKCHGAEGQKVKGGLRLTTREELLAGGDSGAAVVPGKPSESPLYVAMQYHTDLQMPPAGKRPDREIAAIRTWIEQGAAWPTATTAARVNPRQSQPTKGEEQTRPDEPSRHWAFQPLRPTGRSIDAHWQAGLAQAGLTPSAPADPAALYRRLCMDLLGLPPEPEALAQFLNDYHRDPETTWARTIDELLEHPAYGERWGRHWLDVARYADSNGLDENTFLGHAWKYRDYVIRSFQKDLPYDEFLREQIAGDLLPPTGDPARDLDRRIALGFLAIGPKLLAEPDKQKMLLDIADEQLDTIGKSILGLTIGCARCHDHKFDPIPTRDYYSLLAIFTSTRTMQNLNTVAKVFEINLSPPETATQKAIREKLTKERQELKKIEKQFGQTPATDRARRGELHRIAEKHRRILRWGAGILPKQEAIHTVEEGSEAGYGTQPRNLYVQIRGQYNNPKEEAPPGYLSVLPAGPVPSTSPNPQDQKQPYQIRFGQVRSSSGRLELAQWITSPQNPLTARVFVNRVWRHHFGFGLVRSLDNFGRLGETPTHPELLDDLASSFVASGWRLKPLHRKILTSLAYRRASLPSPAALQNDPENRWLSYYPARRLEAEAIRDSILAVSGQLDRRQGGSLHAGTNQDYVGTANYESRRRTIYLPVLRSKVFDFLSTFDFPDPSTPNGDRATTVVAPQALWMLNNPWVRKQAEHFGRRIETEGGSDRAAQIRWAYRVAFSRDPRAGEIQRAEAFLQARPQDGYAALAQALFAANEFIHLH